MMKKKKRKGARGSRWSRARFLAALRGRPNVTLGPPDADELALARPAARAGKPRRAASGTSAGVPGRKRLKAATRPARGTGAEPRVRAAGEPVAARPSCADLIRKRFGLEAPAQGQAARAASRDRAAGRHAGARPSNADLMRAKFGLEAR